MKSSNRGSSEVNRSTSSPPSQRNRPDGDAVALAGDHLPHRAGVLPALKFCGPIDVHRSTIPPHEPQSPHQRRAVYEDPAPTMVSGSLSTVCGRGVSARVIRASDGGYRRSRRPPNFESGIRTRPHGSTNSPRATSQSWSPRRAPRRWPNCGACCAPARSRWLPPPATWTAATSRFSPDCVVGSPAVDAAVAVAVAAVFVWLGMIWRSPSSKHR